jgi:hypothetical protein
VFSPNQAGADTSYEYRFYDGGELLQFIDLKTGSIPVDAVGYWYSVERRLKGSTSSGTTTQNYYQIRRRPPGAVGETSSTIANPGVIVYDAAGVETARQSAPGSSGNNTAITVNVPQLQFDTTKTGEFSVAFRADVASNGNSQHGWKSPNINLTVETIV